MKTPAIVSAQEWEAARQQLLVREKELTRARDQLAAERRRHPWTAVEREYQFDGPAGRVRLLDLFVCYRYAKVLSFATHFFESRRIGILTGPNTLGTHLFPDSFQTIPDELHSLR